MAIGQVREDRLRLKTLGVVGAGPMGAGIAQVGLSSGLEVILYDVDAGALEKAAETIVARLARLEEKGQAAEGSTAAAKDRLRLAEAISGLSRCEVVVEAIVERLEAKQAVFAQLEEVVAADAMIATNTSSLSVAAIGARCRNRGRVCGLHFFNPVPLMALVEVVAAPTTSQETAEWAEEVVKQLGKIPVMVKDVPGFLVNLQGRAYALEALAIVQEGVTDPGTIDRIMRDGAGFRMGPFELMDLTGIDVNYAVSTYIYEGYQHDPRLKTTTLHQLMANAGLYGRKAGRGFFDYTDGGERPVPAPSAIDALELRPNLVGPDTVWKPILDVAGSVSGTDVTLIAPIGEDAASACVRLGLDPRSAVAVDLTAVERKHLTLMHAIGGSEAATKAAAWLRGLGFAVEIVKDSPGFVLQRVLAMIANLGCELAQIGVSAPSSIDTAMKLAQNYPKGPLEIAEWLGLPRTLEIMTQLQAITGSDRYRPSLWLRRRAQLGLSAYVDES